GVTFTTPITSVREVTWSPYLRRHRLHRSLPSDEAHRLGPGRTVPHQAAHRRGDRPRTGLAHPAHRHAQVFALDHHDHATGIEQLHQRIGDLGGETLLHLRALGVDVHQTGELAQAGHGAGRGGDVAHVGHAVDPQQMVFTGGVALDVPHDHHFL